MSVKITMENVTIGDKAKILNDARIDSSDAKIKLKDLILSGESEVLERIQINDVCGELRKQMNRLDKASAEYLSLEELLSVGKKDKQSFWQEVWKHLVSFSEGVAVNVVTGLLMN